MFRYLIVLSCLTRFSYTRPQETSFLAKNNYFDNIRQALQIRPNCVVNINDSHVLAPCNRAIPHHVTDVSFVYEFEIFLCMGVYDSILRLCDTYKTFNSTAIQTLLTSERTVRPEHFCERLQNGIEILNATYVKSEWITVLKQNLHDADACHKACVDSKIGVNPLCSFILEATVIFNSQETRNGPPAKDTGIKDVGKGQKSLSTLPDNKNNAGDAEHKGVIANEPAPPVKKEEINGKNVSGEGPPAIKGSNDVGKEKKPLIPLPNNKHDAGDAEHKVVTSNNTVPPVKKGGIHGKDFTGGDNQEHPNPKDDNTNVGPDSTNKTLGSKTDVKPVPTLSPNSGGDQLAPQVSSGAKDGKPNSQPIADNQEHPNPKDDNTNVRPGEPLYSNAKETTSADSNQLQPGNASSSSSLSPHTDPKELGNGTSDAQLIPGFQPFPGIPSVIEQHFYPDTDDIPIDENDAKQSSDTDFETAIVMPVENVGQDTNKIKSVPVTKPVNKGTPGLQGNDVFVDNEDSHFFVYFVTMVVLCIIGYLVFHNKQKILALTLEGHSRRNTRRRQNTTKYRKLDSNLEEAVTSSCKQSTTNIIY